MTHQAENLMEICRGASDSTITRALNSVSPHIKREIVDHFGGDINVAVTHLKLGSK